MIDALGLYWWQVLAIVGGLALVGWAVAALVPLWIWLPVAWGLSFAAAVVCRKVNGR